MARSTPTLPALILATLAALTLCAGALADQHIQVPDTPEAIAEMLDQLVEQARVTENSDYLDDYFEIFNQLDDEQLKEVRRIRTRLFRQAQDIQRHIA